MGKHGGGAAVVYGPEAQERILREFRRTPDREQDCTAQWSLTTLQRALRAAPDGLPEGKPARQPHEYLRGGTAKLLTRFHPATGQVRAKGVTRTTEAVVYPWLKEQSELSGVEPALRRHHLSEDRVQRAVKRALKEAGIEQRRARDTAKRRRTPSAPIRNS